jgi:hypothetical protein
VGISFRVSAQKFESLEMRGSLKAPENAEIETHK